ncbi:hypothetical protein HYQ46_000320 [Verticillium longisporum]|nr:hypothetical protein HYQ46_000320 [Verticillium longisporum]
MPGGDVLGTFADVGPMWPSTARRGGSLSPGLIEGELAMPLYIGVLIGGRLAGVEFGVPLVGVEFGVPYVGAVNVGVALVLRLRAGLSPDDSPEP